MAIQTVFLVPQPMKHVTEALLTILGSGSGKFELTHASDRQDKRKVCLCPWNVSSL